jgi:hypothetical protein
MDNLQTSYLSQETSIPREYDYTPKEYLPKKSEIKANIMQENTPQRNRIYEYRIQDNLYKEPLQNEKIIGQTEIQPQYALNSENFNKDNSPTKTLTYDNLIKEKQNTPDEKTSHEILTSNNLPVQTLSTQNITEVKEVAPVKLPQVSLNLESDLQERLLPAEKAPKEVISKENLNKKEMPQETIQLENMHQEHLPEEKIAQDLAPHFQEPPTIQENLPKEILPPEKTVNKTLLRRKTSSLFEDIPKDEFKYIRERELTPTMHPKVELERVDSIEEVPRDKIFPETFHAEPNIEVKKQKPKVGKYLVNSPDDAILKIPRGCKF